MADTLVHPPPAREPAWSAELGDGLIANVVLIATLVAAALRLPFTGTQSFWFDETYTIHVVEQSSLGQLWHQIGATESTPPLYYLLTWLWTHFFDRQGEGAMRAISALALIVAVPVSYAALRRLAGRRAACATACLMAVSPLLVSYALDARAYGLLVLMGLLSVGACAALLDRASVRRFAAWALVAAAAIWTHWFAGFLVLGEVLTLLWLRPDAWRRTLLASAAVLVALLPLIGLLRAQTGDDRAAFIAGSGLGDRLEQLGRQFAAGPNVPRTWLEAVTLVLALTALALGTLLTVRRALAPPQELHWKRAFERRQFGDIDPREGARALLAIAAVALLVPLALAISGLYDRFNVRNVLFLWPLAAALAAPALLRLRAAPLVALLALGIATSLWTQTDWRYGNPDWRAAIDVIDRTPLLPIRAELVAVTPVGGPVSELYTGVPVATSPQRTRHVWLVVEPTRGPGQRALGPADPPLVAALLSAFPQHRERRVHGFRVIALDAPAPVTLDPSQLPGATLLAVPRLRR